MSDDAMTPADAAAVDRYVEQHFGVKPPDGAIVANTDEHSRSDEDERFAAYMRWHFPTVGQS